MLLSAQAPIRLSETLGKGWFGFAITVVLPCRRKLSLTAPILRPIKRPESGVPQKPSSKTPPARFSLRAARRSFHPTPWGDYRPGLDSFVHLHGSSNRSRRRSRRAALGAMRTWIPYLWICVHGRCSTTLRIGFQTLQTSPRGNLHRQCSR
jgi:hypothetical protein